MSDFTREDYGTYVEMASPSNFVNDLYNILKYHPTATPYEIKEFLIKKYPSTSRLFYEVPLRQIPKWINLKDNFINTIMTWRLNIGK